MVEKVGLIEREGPAMEAVENDRTVRVGVLPGAWAVFCAGRI